MNVYRGVRYYTNKLLELVDEGVIDPRELASACLRYMSEDDVRDMYESEGYDELDGEEEDDEEDEGDACTE